jgi:hypothetical protein
MYGKYMNPALSPVYSKSVNLYQPLAAPTHKHGQVVVVEGTFDAMAIAVAAIQADAATMFCPITQSGKALSPEQIDYVLSLSPSNRSVVLAFDGDQPGVDANLKYAQEAMNQGKEVVITVLPDDHDPCSYLAEHGPAGLAAWTRFGCLRAEPGEVRPQYGASLVLAKQWQEGVVDNGATVNERTARMTLIEGVALGVSESLPSTATQRFQTQIVKTMAPWAAAEAVVYVNANLPPVTEPDIFGDWTPEVRSLQAEAYAVRVRTQSWLSRFTQVPESVVEAATRDALAAATRDDPELLAQLRTVHVTRPVAANTCVDYMAPLYQGTEL